MARRPSARPEPRLSEAGRVGDRPSARQISLYSVRELYACCESVASVSVALAIPGTPGLRCAKQNLALRARYAHVATVHVALRP
eukprot:5779799-Prymnesium_polylepis.1